MEEGREGKIRKERNDGELPRGVMELGGSQEVRTSALLFAESQVLGLTGDT